MNDDGHHKSPTDNRASRNHYPFMSVGLSIGYSKPPYSPRMLINPQGISLFIFLQFLEKKTNRPPGLFSYGRCHVIYGRILRCLSIKKKKKLFFVFFFYIFSLTFRVVKSLILNSSTWILKNSRNISDSAPLLT